MASVNPELVANYVAQQAVTLQQTSAGGVSIRNSTVQEQKLRRAAQEFEAMLISNFWKAMTESFSAGDEDALDPGHSTWNDMGVQAMAEGISKAGGFGLGKLILKHLEPMVQGKGASKGEAQK